MRIKKKTVKWSDCGWRQETKVELYYEYDRPHGGINIGAVGSAWTGESYLLLTSEYCDVGKFCEWIQHNERDFLAQGFPEGNYTVEKGYVS